MRWVRLLLACVWWLGLTALSRQAAAGDPRLRWHTVETPHFRVHYHGGLERHAQQVASLAELVHERLSPEARWRPREVTHILLTDDTDGANGSATVRPYNLVRMYMSAPGDMSALNHYDEWLPFLFTHEYTHVLHIDNITALPALLNKLLGKTYAPNQNQPKWIVEGWAVALESEYTSGGRLRSPMFDMFLRADVLEDRIASIDQVSHSPRRWPGGSLWYLYGGHFISWISKTYGPDTMAAVAADYGSNSLAWGVNRSIRRATGRTYPELWQGWLHHLRQRYGRQMAEVTRRGLREGTRLTHHGSVVAGPLFAPPCARRGDRDEIWYFADDGHRTEGWYRLPLATRGRAQARPELVIRASGAHASFDEGCGLVHSSVAPSRRRYYFSDLFRYSTAQGSLGRGRSKRLTRGRRADAPAVSPDGKRIVYVTTRAGTSTLRIADYDADSGLIEHERALVPSAEYEQAFTPRFSPDGAWVAYGTWTRGGYRDIRLVEVASGRFFTISHDRATDQQPTWSADGKLVLYTSDRTGIPNVYAFDRERHELWQVTNVRTGAYMPEVTPDGKTLYYVGYTSDGYDLYSMPFERSRWLHAEPYEEQRPAPGPSWGSRPWPVRPYRPLDTARPRSYELAIGPGTFGTALTVSTSGADAAGLHGFSAAVTVDTEEGLPGISAAYRYSGLPFTLGMSGTRHTAPRSTYRYGDENPPFVEVATGVTSGIDYAILGRHQHHGLGFSYSALYFDGKLPVGTRADPYAFVTVDPHRGLLSSLHFGYTYARLQRYAYSISREKGIVASLGADWAATELGSDDTLRALTGSFRGYTPLPWARHHVWANALSGGVARGSYPRWGFYYTGGMVPQPVLDAFQNGALNDGFVLRGYAPGEFVGTQYVLANSEYRLPLAYVDRGVSTLPVFLRSIAAVGFVDLGGTVHHLEGGRLDEALHLGYGAELWFEVILGYSFGGNVRLGYARGTDPRAVPGGQYYLVVASGF